MKNFYYLSSIIFSFFYSHILYCQMPDIIWEKYYSPKDLGDMISFNIFKYGDTLYLTYYAQNPDDNLLFNPGVIVADLDGNVLKRFEIIRNDNIKIFHLIPEGNIINLHCKIDPWSLSSLWYPASVKVDFNDTLVIDNIGAYIDKDYIFGRQFNDNDSLYISYSDMQNFYIDVFSEEVNFVRKININNSSLTIPYTPDLAPAIITTNDNCFLASFFGPPGGGSTDSLKYCIIAKYSKEGAMIWATKLEIPGYERNIATRMLETDDNGYLIAGYLNYLDNSIQFIVKLDSAGKILWHKAYQFDKITYARYFFKKLEMQRGYLSFGYYQKQNTNIRNYSIQYFDELFELKENYVWNTGDKSDINGIVEKENGNLIVYGRHEHDSVYLAEIKLANTKVDNDYNNQNDLVRISPNPASDYVLIGLNIDNPEYISGECEVLSIFGESILRFKMPADGNYRLETSRLPQGNYFFRFYAKSSVGQKVNLNMTKFIIIK